MRGPLYRYRALVAAGALESDPAQERAAERLQALEDGLARGQSFRLLGGPPPAPKGVYIWGEVGRGKSLLMDIFFNNSAAKEKRRVHFHEFMAETHERIARFRALSPRRKKAARGVNPKSVDDPLPPVAHEITSATRLLCLDEFQVRDIADAMVLGRLFEALFARRLVVVATSNRHPDELYQGGINRQLFLPFVDMLKDRLDVIELEAARDYRLARLAGAPVYYRPLGPDADEAMNEAWEQLICGATEREEKLLVQGRMLAVPRVARDAARFDFHDLCGKALGAPDYLAIARRFGTIFIDRIPRMSPEMRNEARRFINLIDAIYDTRTKLVCSADGEPADLYPAGDGAVDFERTASRLLEMRSADYLGAEREATAMAAQ